MSNYFVHLSVNEGAGLDVSAVLKYQLAGGVWSKVTRPWINTATDDHSTQEFAFFWGALVKRLQNHLIETLATVPPPGSRFLFERAAEQAFRGSDGKFKGGGVQGADFSTAIPD